MDELDLSGMILVLVLVASLFFVSFWFGVFMVFLMGYTATKALK